MDILMIPGPTLLALAAVFISGILALYTQHTVYSRLDREIPEAVRQALQNKEKEVLAGAPHYNIFAENQHRHLLAIHTHVYRAMNEVLAQEQLLQWPNFSKYTKEDMQTWLLHHGFTAPQTRDIVSQWDENKNLAFEKITQLYSDTAQQKTTALLMEARQYIEDNQLYVTQSVYEDLLRFMESLEKLHRNYEQVTPFSAPDTAENDALKEDIAIQYAALTAIFRTALQKGMHE